MKKEKLLICDHDLSYVEYLTDYLNRQTDFSFVAVPFTRKDALLEYIAREPCRYLLLDRQVADGNEEAFSGLQVAALLEEPGDGICRYQSGMDLCREILEHFRLSSFAGEDQAGISSGMAYLDEDPAGMPAHGRIIGVYSPVNRCGKTIFAVTLGMILAETQSALYWNLEKYHGLDALHTPEGRFDLADILYRVRMSPDKDMKDLFAEAVTDWGGLDCLNPVVTSYDLNDVSAEEWTLLLNGVLEKCGYQTIVLDIGGQIRDVLPLLSKCSRIYMPVLSDRISQAKVRQFEENLEILHAASLLERIRKVAVPRLRSDTELSGFPRQLPRGKIGSYVRQIVAEEG